MHRAIIALALTIAPLPIAAQTSTVVEGADKITIEMENARESELQAGYDFIRAGKPAEALAKFDAVIAGYEAERRGTQVRCADSLEQAIILSAVLTADPGLDGEATILGANWCSALFAKGFALIDLGRSDQAEDYLERATQMAPFEPHYVNELAELYKNRRQWQRSHDTFARALDIADYPGVDASPRVRARSLRGMGFTMIELGDLDAAEELFRRSQDYDPDSAAARTELEYIASLRAGKT
jgi:tetratricopeptide (TPR) repeat protein